MHSYAIPGPARRIAYLATLAVAATGAAFASSMTNAWMVVPVFLLGYIVVFTMHERWCWQWWRVVHHTPNLTGSWQLGADQLHIRQTCTHIQLVGSVNGVALNSRMAEWRIDHDALVLNVVAGCPHRNLTSYSLRPVADGTLTLQLHLIAQPSSGLMLGWQRSLLAASEPF